MPYYQHERPRMVRQYSGESERTDHLLVKHRHHDDDDDDDIFAGRHLQQTGTMGSKRSKSTPVTVEESLSSGEYSSHHHQLFGVQHQPSMNSLEDDDDHHYHDNDNTSYDPTDIGSHRGRGSKSGGRSSYHSFQQPKQHRGDYNSYTSSGSSYQDKGQRRDDDNILPPEEQYYRDQYFSREHDGGSQCYTDDGEPYYGEDHPYDQQRGPPYPEDGYSYNGHRQPPPYDKNDRGYHHHHHDGHPDDYPPQFYDQAQQQYPDDYDNGYDHHSPLDDYGDEYHDSYHASDHPQQHPHDYHPPDDYHKANSQDYSGYRQQQQQQQQQGYDDDHHGGYPANGYHQHLDHHQPPLPQHSLRDWPQPEDQYSHFDDQDQSYFSYDQQQQQQPPSEIHQRHYSSYEARQNAEGHWEESSEMMDGGTIASKTLNTNLEGMKYMPHEDDDDGGYDDNDAPYDNNYHGDEPTAFDYSEGPSNQRSESPEILFHGASTLASPVHDDHRSLGSDADDGSIWDGLDLRNRSLMDNPVSPLTNHTQYFSIGRNRTDYTGEEEEEEARGTTSHRPSVMNQKFIQKTKKQIGGCAGVTYDNGEFQVRHRSNRGSSRSSKKQGGESATILDIMFNVGHDLILGTRDKQSRRRRQRDPAAKIVDSFKEMFNCGVEEDVEEDYDDYESYRS